ncbi:methylated-DNA--[protein]-cysteine S-methyltransferase [Campylobacter estrildidarum]|uniref:Methylated-DNA--protein-cysteine methyltransferase n=1 Tax=Campylobacter estrildidarum TaxID=2510189 RepID=A0A4U7BKC3_9BACT|nr:methylated-DNA--[protein]-cysteine S-methyltransferase [Campylobacter estrildidarum]TKX30931.1 methylated-DNA--[protein]-cysteine S-methyltransferase [Campylobacter estrildidarum]
MFKIHYKSPICYLLLQSDGKFLTQVDFCGENPDFSSDQSCELLKFATLELENYFSKKIKTFKTPLKIKGSTFEQKAYRALIQIPYGKLATYKEIAQAIHHPKAFRAVGNANSKNNIPIFIPCHRVVASNGLGGYNGGLEIKRFLLETEGIKL